MSKLIIGDDGDFELPCQHGVGHGYGVHTCDGCCVEQSFKDALDKALANRRSKKEVTLEELFELTK